MIVLSRDTVATVRRLYQTSGWDAAADELQRRWPQLDGDDAFDVVERVLARPETGLIGRTHCSHHLSAPYAFPP
ncbi:MAG: hypothetical protein WCK65_10215 [Rhodospirillaceae bacterium]